MKQGILFPAKLVGTIDGSRINAYCLVLFVGRYKRGFDFGFIATRLNRLNGTRPANVLIINRMLNLRPRLNWWNIGGAKIDPLKNSFVIRDSTLQATVTLISILDKDYANCVKTFEKEENEEKKGANL